MKRSGLRPILSVVTIHLNRLADLKRTATSVWSQKKRGRTWEWLVIDGDSRSESQAWIQKNKKKMDQIRISKDRGIYDAMNQGVALARGEWVLFLNAGDVFYDEAVLEKIIPKLGATDADILFGHVRIDYPDGKSRIHRAADRFEIGSGMPSSHQAIFTRREWLRRIPFDIGEKIAGDFGFFCRAHNAGAIFGPVDLIVAGSEAGGVSDTKRLSSIRAHWRLSIKHSAKGKAAIHWRYTLSIIYALSMTLIRWIIPVSVFFKLRHLYWKVRSQRS